MTLMMIMMMMTFDEDNAITSMTMTMKTDDVNSRQFSSSLPSAQFTCRLQTKLSSMHPEPSLHLKMSGYRAAVS